MGLEIYVNEPRKLTIAGEEIEIWPIKVRKIPAVAKALGPAFGPIAQGDIMAVVTDHTEALIAAVAACIDRDEEWIGNLPADQFLELAVTAVEVNADFFVQRVVPMMTGLADRLMPEATGTAATPGATPSPSSSPTVTATATASTTP